MGYFLCFITKLIDIENSITGGSSALSVVYGWSVIIKYLRYYLLVKTLDSQYFG